MLKLRRLMRKYTKIGIMDDEHKIKTLKILQLYPNEMNIYGDRGNVLTISGAPSGMVCHRKSSIITRQTLPC
jgi:hypothetical protein